MIDELRRWASAWGDLASVLGVLLSVLGFAITIVNVRRSKSAAQRAEEAAENTRSLLLRDDVLGALATAIANLEEIRRLHRASAWTMLPDRYASLRDRLIVIRTLGRGIDDRQLAILQEAESELLAIEKRVERALSKGTTPPNPAKFNEVLGGRLTRLQELLVRLRQNREIEK
jgi:hypothetical protein